MDMDYEGRAYRPVTGTCSVCLAVRPLYTLGQDGLNRHLCEPCADRMIECPHTEGAQHMRYDADGCGHVVWRCFECGWEEHDF